jgi:uncharacterized protein (TIGR02246 family)
MTGDDRALQEILIHLENAWNAGDSASFAAQFVEDANFIHIFGGQLDGRRAIEASHRHIFDTIYKGSQVRFVLRGIRFLGAGAAIVFTRANLKFQQGGEPSEIDTRPTLIAVKAQGEWRIAAFQNTRISEIPAA